MIELIARLYPSTGGALSQLIDTTGKRDRSDGGAVAFGMKCPACHGRRKLKLSCTRCAGTGRANEVGGQHSTRMANTDALLTPAYIASLLSGETGPDEGTKRPLKQHQIDAALVYVVQSQEAQVRLAFYVSHHIVYPQAKGWKVSDEVAAVRSRGIVHAAIVDLGMMPKKLYQEHAAEMAGLSKAAWQETWMPRQEALFKRMLGWTQDVDLHMSRMHHGNRQRAG